MLGLIYYTLYEHYNTKGNSSEANDSLSTSKYYFDYVITLATKSEDKEDFILDFLHLANYYKGLILYTQKRFAEARDNFYEYYNYLKGKEPSTAAARVADTYLHQHEYKVALDLYRFALTELNGKSAYSLNGIALCHLYRGEYTLADTFARKSLEFLGMQEILQIDNKFSHEKIDKYTLVAKQSMLESLLIIATAYLR